MKVVVKKGEINNISDLRKYLEYYSLLFIYFVTSRYLSFR